MNKIGLYLYDLFCMGLVFMPLVLWSLGIRP